MCSSRNQMLMLYKACNINKGREGLGAQSPEATAVLLITRHLVIHVIPLTQALILFENDIVCSI